VIIQVAVEEYLHSIGATRRPTTMSRAKQILRGFTLTYRDRELTDLKPQDITEYIHSLPHSNRTKYNHQVRVSAMLRHHGITLKADKPR
jgi:hypothetical protein